MLGEGYRTATARETGPFGIFSAGSESEGAGAFADYFTDSNLTSAGLAATRIEQRDIAQPKDQAQSKEAMRPPTRKRRTAVTRTARYLISLPERLFRSGAALAGGLIRQLGDVTLPAAVAPPKPYRPWWTSRCGS